MTTENLIREQAARRAEGFDIVEWEYADGSGSWGYCEPAETGETLTRIHGVRVWLNGTDLGIAQ